MNKVAIVILNYNGKSFLEQFLPNVVRYSAGEGIQVIVADNNSTDGSTACLKESFPNVGMIELDKNYGYTGGYNKALEQVKSEYFVLLNSDVEVTPGWLEPVIEYLDQHGEAAAAMPKIKSYSEKEYFEYAGASGGYIDKYGYPFCRGRVLSKIEKDEGQHNTITDIFWASGACLFVRSELFFAAGGFDDDFFAHMEEIDLCWRLKRMGYRVVAIPQSEIYHVGGGTLPINTPRKMYLNYRNNLYLLVKNLPKGKLFPVLFVRMCLDGASAMVYLSKFSFGFFWSVIKAHLHFYCHLRVSNRKRKEFRKKVKTEEISGIYPQSMVYSFLVRKKLVFSEYKLT
ncbi:MAG: glycosyltransferase family 2 protein [Bacteroidales bacterium]|nr:glycosyltransferase family 2 protein [Bacteroidales bacterium]